MTGSQMSQRLTEALTLLRAEHADMRALGYSNTEWHVVGQALELIDGLGFVPPPKPFDLHAAMAEEIRDNTSYGGSDYIDIDDAADDVIQRFIHDDAAFEELTRLRLAVEGADVNEPEYVPPTIDSYPYEDPSSFH